MLKILMGIVGVKSDDIERSYIIKEIFAKSGKPFILRVDFTDDRGSVQVRYRSLYRCKDDNEVICNYIK